MITEHLIRMSEHVAKMVPRMGMARDDGLRSGDDKITVNGNVGEGMTTKSFIHFTNQQRSW